ncbi:TauD/TfdA family dioxygenase [Novosphingobium sp. G106]|uniref:TauD/TfdA dioxygenase family protein n=1 Tax=Novosphingobium sp. G106 TaxID=2849500 RepID=UPI001C2CEBFE|nr:TauD/TfdA family dioxygenase [Novosphingobium sp. G106]MBV1691195.1 TauD/TfdA family dioxygenase [Novosphingobium sp. G106]
MFDVAPLPGQDRYGAMITELDPGTLGDPKVRQALHDLWIDKGLVVFRGIPGGIDTQLALSEIYGEPEVHPMMAGTDIKTEHKALAPIEFDREDGNIYEIEGEQRGGYLPWHFDGAYVDRINHGGILRPEVLPGRGGDTGFIDQIAAYALLPDRLKARIEGLSVIYSYQPDFTRAKFGSPVDKLVRMSTLFRKGMDHPSVQQRAIHPLVYQQAETGQKILHVSPWFADGIEGMENPEGDALLAEVIDHVIRPELMYFHKWQPGDMVLWDNWRMLHCATGVPPEETRIMRRTTIVGDYGLGRREEKAA